MDGNLRITNIRKASKSLTERDPVPEAWNRFLADQRPRTREDRERLELRTAQHQSRRAMYAEQKRDRAAIRQAHDAQIREHRAWSRRLYADARQTAFDHAKQQNAKKWEAVRKTKNPVKRELAAAKVKLDTKHVHTVTRNKHLAAARKVNEKAWQAIIKQQTQERKELRAAHQKEQGMLARQQVAERLATDYRFLAERTQSAATRTSAQMSNARGLAGQHKAANRATGDHARRRVVINGETVALPGNPLEASRAYLKLAHAEHAQRKELRQTLTHQRDTRAAWHQLASRSAQTRRSGRVLTGLAEETPRQRADNAAMNGRTLTSEESNAASPEVRAHLNRTAKRNAVQREMFDLRSARPSQGKGRTGGGRGR